MEKIILAKQSLTFQVELIQHHANTVEGRWERSAVAEHSKSCHGTFNWQSKENTLKVTKHDFQRKVREALEIQYHQSNPQCGGLNQDDGQYVTSRFWQPMFTYLSKHRKPTHWRIVTSVNIHWRLYLFILNLITEVSTTLWNIVKKFKWVWVYSIILCL